MESTLDRTGSQTVNDLVAEAAVNHDGRDDGQNDGREHLGIVRVVGPYEFRQGNREGFLRIIRNEDHGEQQLIPVADEGHQTGYKETGSCQRKRYLNKDLIDIRAVDAGGLNQFVRHALEKAGHDENRNRQ